MSNLYLDKEHGVNPSMNICWWCGEVKELLLLGAKGRRLREACGIDDGGTESPREVIMNDEPCGACLERAKRGCVTIVGMKNDMPETLINERGCLDAENQLPAITRYRSGKMWGVKLEACERMMPGIDFDKNRFLALPDEVAEMMGLPCDGTEVNPKMKMPE